MKTRTKALLLVMSALLLIVSTVFATMAYLTSTTEKITNTFTVGNVAITLDEADLVDEYGVADNSVPRVISNEYKLIPGHTYDKDPTIHVKSGSEACYLFVKVVDQLDDIQDTATVVAQMTANGWTPVSGAENVWAYNNIVDARTSAQDVTVFTYFKVKGTANVADYAGKTITVQAYAVQADGFANAIAAWEAAPCSWGP